MTVRSTLLRGTAALALAVGLIATTTASPALAKPQKPESSVPNLPGLPSLPGIGGGGEMGPQEVAQMVGSGLRLAADIAEIGIPLIVEAIDP